MSPSEISLGLGMLAHFTATVWWAATLTSRVAHLESAQRDDHKLLAEALDETRNVATKTAVFDATLKEVREDVHEMRASMQRIEGVVMRAAGAHMAGEII